MKNEFILSIEESLISIKEHGIIVMVNSKNEKLYVKPISHENGFIELKILSMKELGELGITVQESCLNSDFDIEIQESTEFSNEEVQKRFEEERRKKSQQIPLNSVEDAEKMKEIAERAKEILERKDASPEILRAENEDLKAKLELIASRELERRMEMWKIDPETRKAIRENPERLKGYELARQEMTPEFGSAPSGSAPLNSYQIGQNAEGYESYEAMIQDLRDREHSKDPIEANEAKKILDALVLKTMKGLKESKQFLNDYEEKLPETKRVGDRIEAVESDPFGLNERFRKRKQKERNE